VVCQVCVKSLVLGEKVNTKQQISERIHLSSFLRFSCGHEAKVYANYIPHCTYAGSTYPSVPAGWVDI